MSNRPWFKMFASDVLTDEKIDNIPPECLGLILKMWCVCHIEGKCPSDPKEIARKTRLSLDYVLQCKSHCDSLFKLRGEFYISERMEKEKRRSDINRVNANERYKQRTSTIRSANRIANTDVQIALPRSDSDSDYDSVIEVLSNSKNINPSASQGDSLVLEAEGKKKGNGKVKDPSKHTKFKDLIFKCFEYLNHEAPPWDGSDAKQLSLIIRAKPDLDEEKFHQWLLNYAASENINPSDRPRVFLPRISNYAGSPLNQFGRPLEAS